jgi:hypothetical protein
MQQPAMLCTQAPHCLYVATAHCICHHHNTGFLHWNWKKVLYLTDPQNFVITSAKDVGIFLRDDDNKKDPTNKIAHILICATSRILIEQASATIWHHEIIIMIMILTQLGCLPAFSERVSVCNTGIAEYLLQQETA